MSFPTSIYFAITGLYYQSIVLSLGIPVLVFVAVCLPSIFSEGKGAPTGLRILLLLSCIVQGSGTLYELAKAWANSDTWAVHQGHRLCRSVLDEQNACERRVRMNTGYPALLLLMVASNPIDESSEQLNRRRVSCRPSRPSGPSCWHSEPASPCL